MVPTAVETGACSQSGKGEGVSRITFLPLSLTLLWVGLFLAGSTYDIEYKRIKAYENTDELSHLPVKEPFEVQTDSTEIVNLFQLPCSMIVQEAKKGPTLACVYEANWSMQMILI